MDLIWNRKTFLSVTEQLDRSKYITEGEKESLNLKPTAPAVPTTQKTEKSLGGKFITDGPSEKLLYPKVTNKEKNMDKIAAQQLPGSDKVDAEGQIEKGEKSKLTFPTKPGPDPKIKMQGLSSDKDAQKQIDGGESGKINHGNAGKGKDIKIEWQVNTDATIGDKFIEKGEKGDAKKVSGPAKEPGVSMKSEPGAGDFIERGEDTKPIQKQFSLNFKRASAEEKDLAVNEAVDNAILELEVAASKCGVAISATRMATAYNSLVSLKEGVRKNGSLFAITPEPVAPVAPIKVQASAKPAIDEDKAAIEVGARIF